MEPLHVVFAVAGTVGAVAGATWALRTKLSDIEVALRGHVEEDRAVQKNHETRIISLEKRRQRR